MNTKEWIYKNVSKSGAISSGGFIEIKKGLYTSLHNRCKISDCNCIKKHWFCINFGYCKKDKSVSGITFYFDSISEFTDFIKL